MGSYLPWKKDYQRMWVSGKLSQTGGYYSGGKLGHLEVSSSWAIQGGWDIQQKAH